MRIIVNVGSPENAFTLLRRLGYSPDRTQNPHEPSFHRRLGRFDYPRFHIYLHQLDGAERVLNLHLDQKRPSYAGTRAHAGEYDGPTVEREAERIRAALGTDRSV